MKARITKLLLTVFIFSGLGSLLVSNEAFAAKKPHRTMKTVEGKITSLINGRDRKKNRFWEYRLRTKSGQFVIVHDYRYGRYRQPASMGLQEGKKHKVKGFIVHISTKIGNTKKEPVLIVTP